MEEFGEQKRKNFDFSLDTMEFRERLWKELESGRAADGVQLLDDDDLEWVNAAGMPLSGKDNRLPE